MKTKKYTLLTVALLISVSLVSCGKKNTNVEKYPEPQGEVVQESEVHKVEGTLHEINVTESNVPFVQNGISDYKIIYNSDSTWGRRAAIFINRHILKVTGANLDIIEYENNYTYNTNDHIICIFVDDILKAAGIEKTNKNIGNAGYHLITKNNSAFIDCNSGYGCVHGARMFLKQVVGYEIYSKDIVVYEKNGETLPNMDITEKPDIAYRIQSNKADSTENYEMGFLDFNEAFYSKKGIKSHHNTFDYLKPSVYQSSHPKWYSNDGRQLCYTAHGDKEEYQAMVNEVYDKFVACLEDHKEIGTLSFTQQDVATLCSCDGCKASVEKYGNESGAMVKFMNDVDTLLQAELERQASENHTTKREVNLVFFEQ